MLTTQYRMHPAISKWPAARFYEGALHDAPHLRGAATVCAWHARRCLAPYVFYDVADGKAEETNSSWRNDLEAQLALCIVRHLLSAYPDKLEPRSIGIIAPYNGQVRHVQRLLAEALGTAVASKLEVNSVDGFQGREKEVVIMSCVRSDLHRADAPRGVGFLKDARRINVSMTRARRSLFILGHAETLRGASLWRALLDDADARRCSIRAHAPVSIWFEAAVKEAAPPPPAETPDEAADEAAATEAGGGAEAGEEPAAAPAAAAPKRQASGGARGKKTAAPPAAAEPVEPPDTKRRRAR